MEAQRRKATCLRSHSDFACSSDWLAVACFSAAPPSPSSSDLVPHLSRIFPAVCHQPASPCLAHRGCFSGLSRACVCRGAGVKCKKCVPRQLRCVSGPAGFRLLLTPSSTTIRALVGSLCGKGRLPPLPAQAHAAHLAVLVCRNPSVPAPMDPWGLHCSAPFWLFPPRALSLLPTHQPSAARRRSLLPCSVHTHPPGVLILSAGG